MTDSFLHNHQSALDSQREDDAIKDLQDSGIYPDPDNEEFSLQLTKLIKNYVIDLVNHEVDVITDSDWFSEKVYEAVDTVRDSKNV